MSSSVPVSGGTNQSSWANQPPAVRPGWGRDVEPGSAFRGIGRGRPSGRGPVRGGHGRGRGGSRFRGGSSPLVEDMEKKSNPDNPFSKPLADVAKSAAIVSSAGVAPPSAAKLPGRPRPTRKQSDQKSSKKVPSVLVDPAPPLITTSTPQTLPSRPAARRRRSQTPSTSNLSTPLSPSFESKVPAMAPIMSAVTKDLPPHLAIVPDTPSLHIKHDIDALVEHVRAVAMDRPTTPATHIDWARDEDEDSLPDLDDWGVTSSTSVTEPRTASLKDSTISPILEGALKSLPTLNPGTPPIDTPTVTEANQSSVALEESAVVPQVTCEVRKGETSVAPEVAPRNDKPKARRASRMKNGREARSNSNSGDAKAGKEDASKATWTSASLSEQKSSEKTPSPKAYLKVPLHPSLPPKPEAPLGIPPKRYSRNSAGEDPVSPQVYLPPKPITVEKSPTDDKATIADQLIVPEKLEVSEKSVTPVNPSSDVVQAEPAGDTSSVEPQPALTEAVTEATQKASVEQGLSASIHAPVAKPSSAGNTLSVSPNSSAFNPSHGRSRTLGRPSGHPPPHSTNDVGMSDSHSDLGQGVRPSAAQHLRTQSTPPTTGGPHSRIHHSRPVITGDAISRLARTLGGAHPRREVPGVSAVKD